MSARCACIALKVPFSGIYGADLWLAGCTQRMSSEAAILLGADSMGGRIAILLAYVLCCSTSFAEETVEIPLSEVWGNMPGTKNLSELTEQEPRLSEAMQSLWKPVQKDSTAGPAFAVQGVGSEAVKSIYEVVIDKKKPRETFDGNRKISIVFFSHESNRYVHIHKVDRQGNDINVRWQAVPHETQETTKHFAIIPLGKLSNGTYRVNIIHSPMPQKYADLSFREWSDEIARRVVCGSFSFSVSEQGK
jgi:hypothetical protein